MSPTEPSSPSPSPAPAGRGAAGVAWSAVLRGAVVGVCVLVAASLIDAVLDHNLHDFRDSGWIYPLFVAILVGYAGGGFVAGRAAPEAPLTNGLLAGVFAFLLWIPVRIVIWIARDEHKGLFTGHSPAIRPGQLFGHVIIAAGLGLLGGWLGGRAALRARRSG